MISSERMLERATIARSFFKLRHRDNEKPFYCLMGDVPEWLTDLCREAHNGMLPDDYKYQFIVDALDLLIDNEGDSDSASANIEADIYTRELTEWLSSSVSRCKYVDSAIDDGLSNTNSVVYMLSMGQYLERREVFDSVVSSLTQLDLDTEEESA